MTRDRASILTDLIGFRRPVAGLLDELVGYDWDSDIGLVVLTRAHMQSVLQRYLDGEFIAEQCRDWGEAVFGRDDIALEPGFEGLLSEILFDISEPEINWPLTEARAREWIAFRVRFTYNRYPANRRLT